MSTQLYLVRHGETEWNKQLRYQGHADINITDVGREQAKLLAKRLMKEDFDHFYASDLSRAFETAEIIAKPHQKEVIKLPELRETNFGLWEGLGYSQIQQQFPQILENWISDPVSTRLPEGESLGDVVSRVSAGINKLMEQHKDQRILIVGHGGINRVVLALALGMDVSQYWRIRQDNTALNIIDYYDGKEIVTLLNDTNHLKRT